MYRPQRNSPTPSNNAARLAAEAAFSAPPPAERIPEAASTALVVVKKKRALDLSDNTHAPVDDVHEDDADRAPRVFRVPTAAFAELEGHAAEDHSHGSNGVAMSAFVASHEEHRPVHRRARRSSIAKPGPVVTIAGPAHEPVNLAALALELELSMSAKAHAAEEAQLTRLQAQLNELDSVLGQIAKAREFTLSDVQLSNQWQQLTETAGQLGDSIEPGPLAQQS